MPLFFWALLGMLGTAATSAVGGAVTSAATAVGGAVTSAATAVGGAIKGAASSALETFTSMGSSGVEAGDLLGTSTQAAAETGVVTPPPTIAPAASGIVADITGAPAGLESGSGIQGDPLQDLATTPASNLTPTPTGNLQPIGGTTPTQVLSTEEIAAIPKTLPPLGTLSPTTETPSFIGRTLDFIKDFKTDHPELTELVSEVSELADKAPVKEAVADPGTPQAEQAIAPSFSNAAPQLTRATTVSAPIGLDLASADGEVPLTGNQLQGMRDESILKFIAELRTQRRLFG